MQPLQILIIFKETLSYQFLITRNKLTQEYFKWDLITVFVALSYIQHQRKFINTPFSLQLNNQNIS